MHQAISDLAKKLGTQIVHRDAFETWLFDGSTLADHYWVYPDPMDVPGSEYYFEPYCVTYDNSTLLHELGHLQAANPEQKDLPEFGLAIGIANGAGYGPKGGEFRGFSGQLKPVPVEVYDGLVDHQEQDIQECLAQLFSIFWAEKYDIPFDMKDWKGLPNDWNFYFAYKITQNDGREHSDKSLLKTWSALIRFRAMVDRGEVVEV